MPKGEAFTKTSEVEEVQPAAFDLRKYIDGGYRLTKYVELYLKPGLQGEILELDSMLRHLDDDDDRLSGDGGARLELARRIDALRDEMTASLVGIKLRGATDEETEEVRSEAGDDKVAASMALFARQCVSAKFVQSGQSLGALSPQDFRAIYDAVGPGYFDQHITAAAIAATRGVAVDVPFSSTASLVLNPPQP